MKYNLSSWVSTCRIHAEPLACRKPRDWRYLVHKSSTSRSRIPRASRCGTCRKNRQRLLQSCHLHVKDRNWENGCCGVMMFSPSMGRSCLARRLLEDSVWYFHSAKWSLSVYFKVGVDSLKTLSDIFTLEKIFTCPMSFQSTCPWGCPRSWGQR